jgi:hypothetical protein
MDIGMQAEVVLRQAGYETWPWLSGPTPAVCFENEAVAGFLHAFDTGEALLAGWRGAQDVALARHASALRIAGDKAWNIYSVLLAREASPELAREIERIEEDFSMTRKIARAGIQSAQDLTRALLPLLPLISQPTIIDADYDAQLRDRLKDVPVHAVTAFLGPVDPADVARILANAS